MTPTNGDQSRHPPISIPWFGARKMAKGLAIEIQDLRMKYDAARDQLERFTTIGNKMVAELKEVRAERDVARQQIETLGALSTFQLELRNRQLERQIAEQTTSLEREKSEAAAALERISREVKKAHEGLVATNDLALQQEVGIY